MKFFSNKMMFSIILVVVVLSVLACASDPDPLNDFCVGIQDSDSPVFVNGRLCKDPATVTADDFYYAGGLHRPHEITSSVGSKVTMVFDTELPGLNTQGIALSRLDFAPQGLNPPHHHPRSSETVVVLQGDLYVGFITSNPTNPNDKPRLFTKTLHAGDVFVFPRGLVHFQYNLGKTNAVAFVGFNSQNPGVYTTGRALFGSSPAVYPEVLAKGFQVDEKLVKHLQSLTWTGNN